jgi:hypothetical protein
MKKFANENNVKELIEIINGKVKFDKIKSIKICKKIFKNRKKSIKINAICRLFYKFNFIIIK